MDKIEFLPLGSVVKIKGSDSRIMITQRVVGIPYKGKQYLAHYLGCLYPLGANGKDNRYFNVDDIEEVFFKGYADEDEETMQTILNKNIANCKLELVSISKIKKERDSE